jgi:hypothetical protein
LILAYIKLLVISLEILLLFWQGKRGIENQPFQLPNFIAATCIEKIR